jgi:hypothetical protein
MPIEMPSGLPFAVDTWGHSSRRRRHRFLTHAHRDHLVGAGVGADGDGTLYATRLTLSLALRHFPQVTPSFLTFPLAQVIFFHVGVVLLKTDSDFFRKFKTDSDLPWR